MISMPPVESHPLMVYAAVAVALLVLVASAVPKILGPIGKGLADWSRSRREARIASEDADMADVQRQIAYLTEQRVEDQKRHTRERKEDREAFEAQLRAWAAREERWRGEWHQHISWDHELIHLALQHGVTPPPRPAPPFMTPDPSPPTPQSPLTP